MLIEIQDRLFTIGGLLASDPSKKGMQLPTISSQDVEELELEIDRMNEQLPEMRSFVFAWRTYHRFFLSPCSLCL